jgi:hypothetical protein
VARWLISSGYEIRIVIDNPEDRSLYADADFVDIAVFNWNEPSSIARAIEGSEVLLYTCDNGRYLFEHTMKLNGAIQSCAGSLKFIVKLHCGVDQSANPRFAKHPLVDENKTIEASLVALADMLKIKYVLLRACLCFDFLAHWFAADIRNGVLTLPLKATSTLIALSDLSECVSKVLIDPRKYASQAISIYENAYPLDDLPWSISLSLGVTLSGHGATKDAFKEALIRVGFSGQFSSTLSRSLAECSVPCAEIPTSDFAAKLLGRTPLTLVQWAELNEHLFRF